MFAEPCIEQDLHMAIISGDQDKMVNLLADNATLDVNKPDRLGNTALHYAVEHGDTALLNAFLSQTPDINLNCQNQDGNTPLHFACINNDEDMQGILIREGADTTIKNRENQTPQQCGNGLLDRNSSDTYAVYGGPPRGRCNIC